MVTAPGLGTGEGPLLLRWEPKSLAFFLGPLLVVGLVAGALFALSLRPGLDGRTRRAYTVLWIVTLLLGAPAWLFFAATVGP